MADITAEDRIGNFPGFFFDGQLDPDDLVPAATVTIGFEIHPVPGYIALHVVNPIIAVNCCGSPDVNPTKFVPAASVALDIAILPVPHHVAMTVILIICGVLWR